MKKELFEFLRKVKRTITCVDENGVPLHPEIKQDSEQFDQYRRFVIKDGKPTRVFKTDNVVLFVSKDFQEVLEFVFDRKQGNLDERWLYELDSEKLIYYDDHYEFHPNVEYYNYLKANYYSVLLSQLDGYIENTPVKNSYTLEEIKELEPAIIDSLKKIVQEYQYRK